MSSPRLSVYEWIETHCVKPQMIQVIYFLVLGYDHRLNWPTPHPLTKDFFMRRLALAVLLLFTASACTPHQAIDTLFKGSDNATAHRVAQCESKYDPYAVSPTGDHGLFQINARTWNKPGHADPVADWIGRHWHQRYDPATNAVMAKMIRDRYGWDMWSCY